MEPTIPSNVQELIDGADAEAADYDISITAIGIDGDWVKIQFEDKDSPENTCESMVRISPDGLAEWQTALMTQTGVAPYRFSARGNILFAILYCC